jgi:hypothetical protein
MSEDKIKIIAHIQKTITGLEESMQDCFDVKITNDSKSQEEELKDKYLKLSEIASQRHILKCLITDIVYL